MSFIYAAIAICAQDLAELRRGDLIFLTEGNSAFSNAITVATAFDDSLKFIHVGIVDITSDSLYTVIEASPEEGVRIISLEDFLQHSAKKGNNPAVVVKRLNIDFQVNESIDRAKTYIGQPYDWWYMPDNGKMYCSELVFESYRDENGERIFHSFPMNFRAPDGSMPAFWVKLFEQLGEEVPEGILGTNPNDLSKEDVLIEVCRFF